MKQILSVALAAVLLAITGCTTNNYYYGDSSCRPPQGPPPMQHPEFRPPMRPGLGAMPHSTPHIWTSSEPAAPGTIEGKLREEGKHWVRVPGEIKVGSYVQDIYEGRLDQPVGRGSIGKVVKVATGDDGVRGAKVDFGRGYVVGIKLSELSLVKIVSEKEGKKKRNRRDEDK